MSASSCWQISLSATAQTFKAFEAALEPLCEAVTCMPLGDETIWQVTGFMQSEPDRSEIIAAVAAMSAALTMPVPDLKIATVAGRNWALDSVSSFPPVRIGRFYIYGSHETEAPPPGMIRLCLDAGAAFGTGRHASTGGILQALDRLAGRRPSRRTVRRILDMGAGSGILAMAAAKIWRVPVIASDIDPQAVETCGRNIRLNGMTSWVRPVCSDGYRSPLIRKQAPYDVIICNILANPICAMAGDLSRHLAPGGAAVLSGFLEQDWRRVSAAHRSRGLRFVRRDEITGWQTVTITR